MQANFLKEDIKSLMVTCNQLIYLKAGNTSENLLNEICKINFCCIEQTKLLKMYITI